MASPQSGTAGSADAPESPVEAKEADVADPGLATEAREPATEEEPSTTEDNESSDKEPEEPHWIGIKLVDHEGKPAMNARYKIKLSDGTVESGSLDKDGKAFLKPIPEGECEISFPDIHQDEWSLK